MSGTYGSECGACNKAFFCGVAEGQSTCWCFDFPTVVTILDTKDEASCKCQDCLATKLNQVRRDLDVRDSTNPVRTQEGL